MRLMLLSLCYTSHFLSLRWGFSLESRAIVIEMTRGVNVHMHRVLDIRLLRMNSDVVRLHLWRRLGIVNFRRATPGELQNDD